jgi:hypothetical protein
MSVRKRRLIVNDEKIILTVVNPTAPFAEEWRNCVPDSVLLIRKWSRDEIINLLYPKDADTIKELHDILSVDEEMFNFWECIISEQGTTSLVLLTPLSAVKLLLG